MEIILRRFSSTPDSTCGLLFINGEFICYILEDQPQKEKIPGETCIPAGKYEIKFRDDGGMNEVYKKKFPGHVGMLHLQDVPDFEWVYIHPGNTDDHTEGCLLPGLGTNMKKDHTVQRSVPAYSRIYSLVKLAILEKNERVFIHVGSV